MSSLSDDIKVMLQHWQALHGELHRWFCTDDVTASGVMLALG
jgi:hypothetical protein